MELSFLGGAGEIGRSALLVDDCLLIDYGMASSTPPQYPIGDVEPDAVVVSHGHLDHVGAVPALLHGDARPPVHWTPPTRDLAMALSADTLSLHGNSPRCPFTDVHRTRLTQVSETHGYRDPFETAGYGVTFFDAGHIPGSAHVLVDDGDTRLLYTGDFHTADQRLVAGTTARPEADVVVTESTYADVSHTPRDELEATFVECLRTTIWEGGTAVVPVSAQVEQFDFSAHADRDGLRSFLDTYEGTELLVVHGEDCAGFATDLRADGHEAAAPGLGDTVRI